MLFNYFRIFFIFIFCIFALSCHGCMGAIAQQVVLAEKPTHGVYEIFFEIACFDVVLSRHCKSYPVKVFLSRRPLFVFSIMEERLISINMATTAYSLCTLLIYKPQVYDCQIGVFIGSFAFSLVVALQNYFYKDILIYYGEFTN